MVVPFIPPEFLGQEQYRKVRPRHPYLQAMYELTFFYSAKVDMETTRRVSDV